MSTNETLTPGQDEALAAFDEVLAAFNVWLSCTPYPLNQECLAAVETLRAFIAGAQQKPDNPNTDTVLGDGPCQICGEQTDSGTGNASKWPCYLPDNGVMQHYHIGCVKKALQKPGNTDALVTALRPVLDEIEKAVTKFPTWPSDPLHALAVLGEEFGELTKSALQLTYEPHKTSADEFRTEAKQTAAMALRFYLSLETYEFSRCEQHKQQALRQPDGEGVKMFPLAEVRKS